MFGEGALSTKSMSPAARERLHVTLKAFLDFGAYRLIGCRAWGYGL